MHPHYLWLAAHRKSQKMCFCMKVRLSKSFRRQLRTCLARSQLFHLVLDLLFLVYNLLNLIKLKYGLPGSSMKTKHSQTNEMLRTEIFTALWSEVCIKSLKLRLLVFIMEHARTLPEWATSELILDRKQAISTSKAKKRQHPEASWHQWIGTCSLRVIEGRNKTQVTGSQGYLRLVRPRHKAESCFLLIFWATGSIFFWEGAKYALLGRPLYES